MSDVSTLIKNIHTDQPIGLPDSIPNTVLKLVSYQVAIEYFVLPIALDDYGRIEMLRAYPHDSELLQKIQLITGAVVRPRTIDKEQILKLIAKHYDSTVSSASSGESGKKATAPADRLQLSKNSSAMSLVDDMIAEAIRLRASDIHIEPFEREMRVRFRVDGVLQEMLIIPPERRNEVTSRIKILSGMDISEKRRSQDGKIRIPYQNRSVDLRSSTMPTDFGEKVVLRILDKTSYNYSLDNVGMDASRLSMFKRAIELPNGIVLLTGPTGSGKTTTLYGAMNFLKKPGLNISTIEDPIEYNIAQVNQTQVNTATGMTFAQCLRTLLRQDPDIIMLGEMRDHETAEIAIRSSLTGHLVLSTLHTNDAPSAITRLVDMGIEPYLVSSSVTMIVAQRLVRVICDHCKAEEIVSDEIRKVNKIPADMILYKGLGCSVCGYTGYKGRLGVFEVLPLSENIRDLINKRAFASELRSQALTEGMVTLRDDALIKLRNGITSLTEVLRETTY